MSCTTARLDPRHAGAHRNLANLLSDPKLYADAVRHYRQSLAARPQPAALTGLGIALARLSPSRPVRYAAPALGLAAAIFFHALHNITMFGGVALSFLAGLTFDWGGIVLTLAIIVFALARERQWMRDYLADEVSLGTLTADEYVLVRSAAARNRRRLGLLLREGPDAYRRSGRRYREVSELAYYKRHHAVFGDERSLLAVQRLRQTLRGGAA